MTTKQPTCAYCGKPLPRHTTRINFAPGQEPKNREEAQRKTNMQITRVSRGPEMRYLTDEELARVNAVTKRADMRGLDKNAGILTTKVDEARGNVIRSVNVWDGTSYERELFCTNNCAMSFGF